MPSVLQEKQQKLFIKSLVLFDSNENQTHSTSFAGEHSNHLATKLTTNCFKDKKCIFHLLALYYYVRLRNAEFARRSHSFNSCKILIYETK